MTSSVSASAISWPPTMRRMDTGNRYRPCISDDPVPHHP
mgnify:CR=1 FL=1